VLSVKIDAEVMATSSPFESPPSPPPPALGPADATGDPLPLVAPGDAAPEDVEPPGWFPGPEVVVALPEVVVTLPEVAVFVLLPLLPDVELAGEVAVCDAVEVVGVVVDGFCTFPSLI